MKAIGLKTKKRAVSFPKRLFLYTFFLFFPFFLPYHHFLSGLAIEGNDV